MLTGNVRKDCVLNRAPLKVNIDCAHLYCNHSHVIRECLGRFREGSYSIQDEYRLLYFRNERNRANLMRELGTEVRCWRILADSNVLLTGMGDHEERL